jgi:hypothetical protein
VPSNKESSQVFINCPFDDEYRTLFRAIVFTILDCGLVPRCALEFEDADIRLNRIIHLIDECKYGVHDISRVQLDPAHGLPRFNMPFELGVFLGARRLGEERHKRKSLLVLERERYRYQIFLSDLAGMDIKAHSDSVDDVIRAVRDWLAGASRRTTLPGAAEIARRFQGFTTDFEAACADRGRDPNMMIFVELTKEMTEWLRLNRVVGKPLF